MGEIKEVVELIGNRKSKKIKALFDSGAYRNYIKRKFEDGDQVEDIGFHIFEGKHEAILANGSIALGERVKFKGLHINGCSLEEPKFVIMDDLVEEMVIGVEVMQKLGIILNPPEEKIMIKKNLEVKMGK